ncbi:E3 ubiquitin-protein ligase parkin [Toxocara canis]|uniref:RBR-type E3 ubiquitin transferase n=1 Tax=Toxocara canis TaxID=6265 RepID=A0A0B2UTN0_TOXCA|nr:E3 ubiquitin-protein ligase parkin [Toxocara canis]
MQLLVSVRNRSQKHYAHLDRSMNLHIDVPSEGTISDVIEVLARRIKVSPNSFKIILCGKVLGGATSLHSLLLGPQTSLAAVVVDVSASDDKSANASSSIDSNRTDVPSFHVFCKGCNSLAKGKLRVYCARCLSSSVVLKRDPEKWSDVLSSRAINAECEDCEEETFAKFCFKCVICDEVAVPLTHVRGYRGEGECSICGETALRAVVDVGCHHETCVDCFTAYMETAFTQQQFFIRPPYGYTLSCPVYGCRGCVTDVHLFYLLGKQRYSNYQTQATEKFVSLENEGIFCPYSGCGAAFLWEQDVTSPKVLCPECHRLFCGVCRREHCVCEENDATELTIKTTCHSCPTCGVPTERNGGCAHMHCAHCGTHWCFICVKPWTEECQWDHWFD